MKYVPEAVTSSGDMTVPGGGEELTGDLATLPSLGSVPQKTQSVVCGVGLKLTRTQTETEKHELSSNIETETEKHELSSSIDL